MAARVTVYDAIARVEAAHISTERRLEIAAEIVSEARGAAPVRTGEYRDGIAVQASGDFVSVVDNDPESIYKEYGTSDTPAHAVLTDAAKNHGRYSGWQPK